MVVGSTCGMNARWTQFTLRLIFFVTLAIACYLAGRVPQVERVKLAEAQAVNALEHSIELEQVAGFWKHVALSSRQDLSDAVVLTQSMWDSRKGIGGSYVTSGGDDGRFRPRYHRWHISFSDEEDEHARQLDALGIKLVAVWQKPASIQIVSNVSETVPKAHSDEIPFDALIMKADYLDYVLLERSGLPPEPTLAVRLLPPTLEDRLAWHEYSYAEQEGLKVENILQTDFELRLDRDDSPIAVVGHKLRNREE